MSLCWLIQGEPQRSGARAARVWPGDGAGTRLLAQEDEERALGCRKADRMADAGVLRM